MSNQSNNTNDSDFHDRKRNNLLQTRHKPSKSNLNNVLQNDDLQSDLKLYQNNNSSNLLLVTDTSNNTSSISRNNNEIDTTFLTHIQQRSQQLYEMELEDIDLNDNNDIDFVLDYDDMRYVIEQKMNTILNLNLEIDKLRYVVQYL